MTCLDRMAELRGRLAGELEAAGIVRSAVWREAVEVVPREVFVPRFFVGDAEHGTPYELVEGSNPDQRERWATLVHDAGTSLVTEYDPRTLYPTSSATMPRIVVEMLEALDVGPGHRVLEIGTGSGYSAALLCERVGSENVTTVDIGDEVVELARERLGAAGYGPAVIAADGFEGHPPGAPYDRLISTCTAQRVPRPWVEQTRAGGLMVMALPGGVVRLARAGDGSASGRFHPGDFGFMSMRGHAPAHLAGDELAALAGGPGESRPAIAGTWAMLEGREIPAFWPLALLRLMPFVDRFLGAPGEILMVARDDRSWIRIEAAAERVTQGGPRPLWDLLETLYHDLEERGRPGRERLGITVRADGRQWVWLDDAGSESRWEL